MKKINLLIISLFMISTTSCGETDLSSFSTENDTNNSDFTSSIEDTNTSLTSSNSTTSSDDDKDDVNNNLNEFNLLDNPQEGVILHCFSWNIDNIISYLPQIAEAGFSSIQTSPLQPQLDYYQNGNWKDQWWKLYQPMGFTVADDNQNVLGSKDDLKRLCEEADKYGINVIVDAVLNHLGGGNSEQLNSNVKNYEPEIYNQNLIHTGVGFVDDSSAYKVIKGYQGGFPDIQTENQIVQDAALDMLKEYVDLGVDGFRFDAAKHIETPSDEEELRSDYWDYVLDNTSLYAEEKYNKDIYYYGEILKRLYIFYPKIYWYDLLFYILLTISVSITSVCIFKKNNITFNIIAFLTMFFVYLPLFLSIQFTIVSGILAVAAVILAIYTINSKISTRNIIINCLIITFCTTMSCLIRFHAFFAVAIIGFIYFLFFVRKENLKKVFVIFFTALLAVALNTGLYMKWQYNIKKDPATKRCLDFNTAQVALFNNTISAENIFFPWTTPEKKIKNLKELLKKSN